MQKHSHIQEAINVKLLKDESEDLLPQRAFTLG